MVPVLILPLFIAIIAFFIPKKFIKEFAVGFGLTFFLFSLSLIFNYNASHGFNYTYINLEILSEIGGSLSLGLDGLGVLMVVLTNFVVLYVCFMSWTKDYDSSFYAMVFLMQFALIGVFSSLNAILFYFFWELALLPIYYIVYRWSQGEGLDKTFTRFFIFTFVGSLFILAAFISFQSATAIKSFDLREMTPQVLEGSSLVLFTILLFIGFGVKIPIFPLHAWQAETYRKSPAEGTILLSGIMLKMGLFGLLRWYVPFQQNAIHSIEVILIGLCTIGILYGAIIALRRFDLKLIAAFSSLSHVGLIAAAILTLNYTAFQGAGFQMLVHGINIVGVFYMIDIIERATGTRDLRELGGISTKFPAFAVISFFIILGSIAVPLTNGFVGEFMLLMSLFLYNPILALVAGITIIIGAAYMLRVFNLAFMGETSTAVENAKPLMIHDMIALGFIAVLVLAIGIYPQYLLDLTAAGSQYWANLLEMK